MINNFSFAVPRYRYQSYTDYYKLIELSGFPCCFIDEMNLQKDISYIISPINGEFRPFVDSNRKNKRAKLIWYFLERPIEVTWEINDISVRGIEALDLLPDYIDEIWVADLHLYSALPISRRNFVPVGSDPGLGFSAGIDRHPEHWKYDYIHLSYPSSRRAELYSKLASKFKEAPNAWPPTREFILAETALMLNIHQDHLLMAEPLRFAVAAANKMPILSEEITNPYPLEKQWDYLSVPISEIKDWMEYTFLSYKKEDRVQNFIDIGNRIFQKLCIDFSFKKNIIEGLGLK